MQKNIYKTERQRIFANALKAVANKEREESISAKRIKLQADQTTKECPACKKRFKKNKRKCPSCGTFYARYLSENPEEKEDDGDSFSKDTSIHYSHVLSKHPQEAHSVCVLDPGWFSKQILFV